MLHSLSKCQRLFSPPFFSKVKNASDFILRQSDNESDNGSWYVPNSCHSVKPGSHMNEADRWCTYKVTRTRSNFYLALTRLLFIWTDRISGRDTNYVKLVAYLGDLGNTLLNFTKLHVRRQIIWKQNSSCERQQILRCFFSFSFCIVAFVLHLGISPHDFLAARRLALVCDVTLAGGITSFMFHLLDNERKVRSKKHWRTYVNPMFMSKRLCFE